MHGKALSTIASEPTGEAARPRHSWSRAIARNALVLGALLGVWLALETGYFSNDRTPRAAWNELEVLKAKGKGRLAYEASFSADTFTDRARPGGHWDYYNGATAATASVQDGTLVVRYTSPWIGAYFLHRDFEPAQVYRVRFEAKVEEQAAAILMRNRQLDLLRQSLPVTEGRFKEFTAEYVTPGGRFDQVRLIFMPDERSSVKGKLTIRKLQIEKLER